MHDIDTTRLEFEGEDSLEAPEEFEQEWGGEFEFNGELEAVLDEGEVEELASELLGVSSEAELDQFLGGFLKKLRKKARGVGGLLKRAGGPIFGALKGLAKKALPFVGGALGTAIPIPGVGTAVGSALGSMAANALEAELESLNDEDREFEMAQRFVRLADEVVTAASRQPLQRNPRAALISALRRALARLRAQVRRRRRWRPCPPCPQPAPAPATPVSSSADVGGSDSSATDVGDQGDTGAGGAARASSDQSSEWEFEGEALERRRRRARAGRSRRSGGGGTTRDQDDTDDYGDDSSEWEFEAEALESGSRSARTGRWVRRGTKIVLLGV